MPTKLVTAATLLLLGSIPKEEPGAIVRAPALEGRWDLVSIATGNILHPYANYFMNFTAGKVQFPGATLPYKVDRSTFPPRVSWEPMHGLYAIKGDTLMLYMSHQTAKWPTGFDAQSGAQYIYLLKRARPAP